MKTTKRLLSILLATILILSLFPVTLAQASETAITFSAETDAKNVKAGDTVSVDICMSENSVVAALTLVVNYDNTALKILDVKTNNAFGYEEFNTAYGNNKLAFLTASASPKTVSGTLFTINFEVLKEGCTEISLSVDELTDVDLNPLSSSTQSAKIHKFDNGTVTPPTCTDKGYTTYTCTCGYSYQADETDAKGHSFSDWTTETEPSCTGNGLEKRVCSACSKTEETVIPANGHDYDTVVTPPTCTAQGYTTYTCECGDTYIGDYVNANGHSYNPVVTPPTCTATGYTTYTCSVCGDTYVDDETSATGHTYESEITTPATHTENGVMTYTCHCGDTYTETINATGDHFYAPTVTPPTCTEQGFTTYTCVCGDTYVDDYVDASGHEYESEITTPATHLAEGLMTYTCHCNDTYTEVIERVTEHNYESAITPPTCTEQGFTTYTCECGDTYVGDYVNANGHSYSDGICTVCDTEDPDYYVFSIKAPSRTTIRNKDGIILHTEITGNRPDGSYVEWTSDNNNFNKTVMNDGDFLKVIANNKGNTTFTATLCDTNGNILATDTVELYSQSGFFDKIGGFFRSIFGTTKIYES